MQRPFTKHQSWGAKLCFAGLAFLIVSLPIYAQQTSRFWNEDLAKIATQESHPGWIYFREDARIDPFTIFVEHQKAFGLSEDDDMRLIKEEQDLLGFTHYRYQQFYKGVQVDGAIYIVHRNADGRVYCANGKLAAGLDLEVQPGLQPEQAIYYSLRNSGGKKFLWESDWWENLLKEETGNPDATHFPQPELVINNGRAPWGPEHFRLAYTVDIYMADPPDEKRFIIDAFDGSVINELRLSSNCSPTTTATIWNGNQTINTDSFMANQFRLHDDCQSAVIMIRDWNNDSVSTSANPQEITSADNTWGSMNQQFGASTLWATKQSHNMFLNQFGRNSHDNANGNVNGFVNAFFNCNGTPCTDNASMSFSGGRMKVGLGSGGTLNNSWGTLDIIGHEYAHAVTGSSSGLIYQDESGALNESFSDIFGEVLEVFTLGANDWLIGNDRANGAIRSMSNPNAFSDPDTYNGTNWCDYTNNGLNCTMNDNGGVHINSGVQNFWFYLLSVGGMGANDNGANYDVTGIGINSAAAIAYRNLTVYLGPNSTFSDALDGAVQAARDLFGECSVEEIMTARAWFAVGVSSLTNADDLVLCGTITSGYYEGANTITAAGGCEVNVQADNEHVIFQAGDEILLLDSFTARAMDNNRFLAHIKNCEFSADLLDPQLAQNRAAGTQGMHLRQRPELQKQEQGLNLKAYPNPTSGELILEVESSPGPEIHIFLYDLNGRMVRSPLRLPASPGGSTQVRMDLGREPAGIYWCKVVAGNQVDHLRIALER